jgi:membrane protein
MSSDNAGYWRAVTVKDQVKAVGARLRRSQLWRAWKRYGDRRGNRLAGATSFFAFLSLFPLIVLAAAITGKLLNPSAVEALKAGIAKNLPGIADKINIDSLIAHAGTIGIISGVSLLLTGLGWIDSLRASIRSMHELDDQPGNVIKLKLADLGALIGLGVIGLIATVTSSILSGLSRKVVAWADLDGTWLANWGLQAISVVLGVLTGGVLFLYLQTGLPRIILPRKVALRAALAGGIMFYLAQKLGNLYVDYVLRNNQAYGALALPLALLVWIYLMTRVIMLIAAWAKEATVDQRAAEAKEAPESSTATNAASPQPAALPPGLAGKKFKVIPIPERKADTVAVAAGAVLGATAAAIAVQLTRAVRSFRR